MKTLSLLRLVLPLVAATSAFACTATTEAPPGDPDKSNDAMEKPSKPAAEPSTTQEETPAPAPTATAIALAKVHDGVKAYALTNDAVFLATDAITVRTALDGTGETELTALKKATVLATDGTRVYGLITKTATSLDLFSTTLDGAEGVRHAAWSTTTLGRPTTLSLNADRVYVTSNTASDGNIVSAIAAPPPTGRLASLRVDENALTRFVPPAFTADRLLSIDYWTGGAMRMSLADRSRVDMLVDDTPAAAGGIATDGTDVYVRLKSGIAKLPVGSGVRTEPIVVVPAAACPVSDAADGIDSALPDTLTIKDGMLYAACRNGANVEIRSYTTAGALSKTLATQPYNGEVAHLRVNSSAVYWMSKPEKNATASELWRVGSDAAR